MNITRIAAPVVAVTVIGLASGGANANYYLNQVTNNSQQTISVASLIPNGSSVGYGGLGRNGFRMGIAIPKFGVVNIYEDGTKCPGYSWAAKIEYGAQKWGFGYEGDGKINITINADSTIVIGGSGTPGGNGKVFPGGC